MANPMLRESVYEQAGVVAHGETMTVAGTSAKTLLLFIIMCIPASWVWWQLQVTQNVAALMPLMWGGLIGGLVLSLVTVFKPDWAAVTAPLYAICEGFVIGLLSTFFEAMYPGIVIQAVGATFGVAGLMFTAYATGLLRPTRPFITFVVAASGGICLLYLANIVLASFFGMHLPFIHEGGLWGIVFSLVVVCVAALNLIIDFGFIAKGAEQGAPKSLEWYGAFGLLVTMLWLYLEMLRLLGKLRSR
ncbi:MAG TPA: Bax inhibitor-1/YccA family protein [bacterium]|nr:Bax inhibitor-1/YccA family protein [bacterium]